MSISVDKKYIWSGEREKKPSLMENNGELLAEQKSNNTIEDIVMEMMMNGKLAELARYRNASTAKSAEEAMAQATKLPQMLSPMDIKEAELTAQRIQKQLDEMYQEQADYDKIVNDLKANETLTPKTE